MSIDVLSLVWRARLPEQGRKKDSSAKLVLARLADIANDTGGSIYPSVPRIAGDCDLGERTVQEALRRLQGLGVLLLVREADCAARESREYRIDLTALKALIPSDHVPSSNPASGARFAPDANPAPGANITPDANIAPPWREVRTSPGAGFAHQPPEEPPCNHHENLLLEIEPQNCPADPSTHAVTGEPVAKLEHREVPQPTGNVDVEFQEWYAIYPRKEDPKKARNAYWKARKEGVSADELLEGVRRYASQVRAERRERKFIKHPTSWLNAGSWANELETSSSATAPPARTTPTMAAAADLFNNTPEAHREREAFRI